jgi:hypothetical protein
VSRENFKDVFTLVKKISAVSSSRKMPWILLTNGLLGTKGFDFRFGKMPCITIRKGLLGSNTPDSSSLAETATVSVPFDSGG